MEFKFHCWISGLMVAIAPGAIKLWNFITKFAGIRQMPAVFRFRECLLFREGVVQSTPSRLRPFTLVKQTRFISFPPSAKIFSPSLFYFEIFSLNGHYPCGVSFPSTTTGQGSDPWTELIFRNFRPSGSSQHQMAET